MVAAKRKVRRGPKVNIDANGQINPPLKFEAKQARWLSVDGNCPSTTVHITCALVKHKDDYTVSLSSSRKMKRRRKRKPRK